MERLKPEFCEIESNGTLPLDTKIPLDQITISPKYSEKKVCISPAENIVWKFIIGDQEDVNFMENFRKEHQVPKNKIFVQPKASTKKELLKRMDFALSVVQKYGYRLSPRLHILLWDDKRAV